MTDRGIYADESWSVEFSRESRAIVIATTDYHAGPLRITEKLWRDLGRSFEPEGAPAALPGLPPDRVEVRVSEPWTISVSRRKREMIVECADAGREPLRIPRKELYRIGRSMGKRGRRRAQR